MLKCFGSSLIILLLLTGCFGSGGGGGDGDNGAPATNANLSDLVLSAGLLDQVFQALQTDYTATVGFLAASTTVTPTAEDVNATITVNGTVVLSGAASGFNSLNEGPNTITVVVTAEDGITTKTYTIDITRQLAASFAQRAFGKASNAEEKDQFGFSGALSGDTLVVGAIGEGSDDNSKPGAGAVYVFACDINGICGQQDLLRAANADEKDQFGFSVALSEDTLVVGAIGEGGDDNSKPGAGAVYVFTRDNTGVWSQQDLLRASNADEKDRFGFTVALSGDTLAVGADGEGGDDNSKPGAGAVYVFTRDSNGVWGEQDLLRASNADAGDLFGQVALEGDTLAVGAVGEGDDDNSKPGAGAVYVFTRDNTGVWSQQDLLRASNADEKDQFGFTVALSGDTLAVGAIGEGSGDNSKPGAGAVYVFTRDSNGVWGEQDLLRASNADEKDRFGFTVALSGDTLAVGADGEGGDDNSAPDAGAVYVFFRSNIGVWSQQLYLKASNADVGDLFGRVVLSGDILAVGAVGEGSSAGGEEDDNSAPGAGAGYFFQ